MPIYEYVCPDCGLKFELLRSISEADKGVSCPKCQAAAQRVLSTFACFSTNESGISAPIGGSSCSSCSASSCDTCGL